MSPYLLSIDQGTTGTRAILYDQKGRPRAQAYREFKQYFPKPGWVEHAPEDLILSTRQVIQQALTAAAVSPSRIAGIGISNQRETVLLWNADTGRPLHRAIVWQDRRTSAFCETLKKKKGLQKRIQEKTGLVLDPYFSATKLRWMFDHIPSAYALARKGKLRAGTVDTWLLWNLTGGKSHATDYTNASRTLLFNIETKQWDEELLRLFKIPAAVLPRALPSGGKFALTAKSALLPAGIPVYAMIGDQQAALYGQSCYEAGTLKNTYGTGGFMVLNTGRRKVLSQRGLLTTLACDREGKPVYALEGSIFIAGALMQWIRDGLGLIQKASESEALALSVKSSEGVYIVPALTGLGAPYWDSQCRGSMFGLTRGTTRAHVVRAALEAIAYQTVDVALAMAADSRLKLSELKVDGGATANHYLMRFQADILGMKVLRSSIAESTAWGAAKLAGLKAGLWDNPRAVDKAAKYSVYRPVMKAADRKEKYAGWLDCVRRTLTRF